MSAMAYDPKIWYRTSNKYRIITRLPEGKTAAAALKDASPSTYANFVHQFEAACLSQYLRCYAPAEDKLVLTDAEFDEFKRAGGQSP